MEYEMYYVSQVSNSVLNAWENNYQLSILFHQLSIDK